MKAILIILLIHLTIPTVLSQEHLDLKGDESISKIFNLSEIKGLESMVYYVDSMVVKERDEAKIDRAYHRFFDSIAQSTKYQPPLQENEKYQFLNSLDSIQFGAVWRYNTDSGIIRTRDTVYRNLDNFIELTIKPYGKYMDYLEEVGKQDPYFKKLHYHFEAVGNLSAGDYYWFLKNHSLFDFAIPKNRLWAVVFILRMEDTFEVKLDRYLSKEKGNGQ